MAGIQHIKLSFHTADRVWNQIYVKLLSFRRQNDMTRILSLKGRYVCRQMHHICLYVNEDRAHILPQLTGGARAPVIYITIIVRLITILAAYNAILRYYISNM